MKILKKIRKKVNQINLMQIVLFLLFVGVYMSGCSKGNLDPDVDPEVKDTIKTPDLSKINTDKIYIPQDLKGIDLYKSTSKWYYGRSKQSDHFIVFWGADYGNNNPNSAAIPETYRVDIDDLLLKAEGFFDMNVNKLKFAQLGAGKSNLDKYKMMIFINYQEEWLATGAGYDDVIGALWVSPSTCHPVGSVIAHEIGHCFQYQVFCDLKNGAGFRYGFGGNGGNGFWEQCAQWQAYQSYPDQVFDSSHFPEYCNNYHRHICHEDYRYASYFIQYYWSAKHGIDMIGRIWREAREPEDPMQAYMRITGITVEQFNDEIFQAASKMVTWDFDAIRNLGVNYIGKQTFNSTQLEDGSYQVAYNRCPGTTGYNVIPLNIPVAGTVVSTEFTGMTNAAGFNQVAQPAREGWRYGYVALLENGTRVYGPTNKGTKNTVSFTVPEHCNKLWLVVTGAPTSYASHAWDDNEKNDDQWPYKVKFSNTGLLGDVSFSGNETPKDLTLTFNIEFPYSATVYPGATVELNDEKAKVAMAFVLQPGKIASEMGKSVKWYAVEKNGTLNATTTANGYGHWFDSNGNVCSWGDNARVFSEFNATNWSFSIGQYPGKCASGDKYTVRQAMVYEYESGKTVKTEFVFNITIK